ncbi:protoporphyrinogen oxidase [Rhizoctonia solani AG-1 IA]|uniref:Protoporphyrinogen oxidase n=1 Tax=Thanatephorus cucumeris (strain AG1-IA) TaxID=983506 RepID=L8WEJ8_THACA|nr:protoporphyrinogen oxidase [Rhizoctonia solani AG-1 IA]
MATAIGVLGGGISGLATAFHLVRRLPPSFPVNVILFEKNKRLGGWIKSESVELSASSNNASGTHSVVLETGPRTLRPRSLEMLELIHLLDLEPALVLIQNSHPAARNRFVYFPETAEPFKSSNRPLGLTDESFDQFISRRFGSEFARRFGSSLIHGIYAADSRKLSIRAAFASVWDAEDRGGGSVIRGILRGTIRPSHLESEYELGRTPEIMKGVSVYTFKGGMGRVVQSLEGWLRNDPRVEVRAGSSVHAAKRSEDGDIVLETSTGEVKVSHLVSTLPLSQISSIISSPRQVLDMGTSPYSTVHVVNMVFSPGQFPIHPPGFGYLVPRPEAGYDSADNPVLGCVFDSATVSINKPTVLTLMLGGPFPIRSTQLSMEYILSLLSRHLGHERLPEPIAHRYHIHHDCIPTPLVGHLERISTLREAVQQEWAGSLEIIGSGVGGVSLGDCVRDGRAAAINIARRLQSVLAHPKALREKGAFRGHVGFDLLTPQFES